MAPGKAPSFTHRAPHMALDLLTARLACVGMVVLFVGGLYLVPAETRRLPRDDPRHIRARFVAVAVASAASAALAGALLQPGWGSLEWIGLPLHGLLPATVLPLLLTACLFLGPLTTTALYLRRWRVEEPVRVPMSPWRWTLRAAPVGWGGVLRTELAGRVGSTAEEQLRALVVGPLCEEVVFRGCMLPLLLAAGQRPLRACLECPLVFGLAHLHHAYERVARGTHTWSTSVLVALVQNAYTYIFGLFACFLLLRTGNLWGCFLAHSFCNLMGLPDISFCFGPTGQLGFLQPERALLLLVYAVGIAAFSTLLFTLTEPELYGGSWFWTQALENGNGTPPID